MVYQHEALILHEAPAALSLFWLFGRSLGALAVAHDTQQVLPAPMSLFWFYVRSQGDLTVMHTRAKPMLLLNAVSLFILLGWSPLPFPVTCPLPMASCA